MKYVIKFILCAKLGFIYAVDLFRVLTKEIKEPGYLPQEEFKNCIDRAVTIHQAASVRVLKILALAIALHRWDCHKEDNIGEQEVLKEELSNGDIRTAKAVARSWWKD